MSFINANTPTDSPGRPGAVVPAPAREIAARLSGLFETDRQIVIRLSSAQARLRHANDRLCPGVGADTLTATWQQPGVSNPVVGGLGEIRSQIHQAFCEYQSACEERRQLAVQVGELAQRLTDVLCAAGFSAQQARQADVRQLAETWPANERTRGLW